jgi:protein ImuA
MPRTNQDIMAQLQRDILPLQGFKPPSKGAALDTGLGPVEAAFPNGTFPTGAVHEFLSSTAEDAAATGGFIAPLLAALMRNGGSGVWISSSRTLFPPALSIFGVEPDQMIFIDLPRERDVIWAMEEALKCEGLAAVIGEIKEIDLTSSRRLQLAVEKSRVTGFILRHQPRHLHPIAAVARWNISPLASELEEGLPGVGYPRWNVELEKVRNGKPGNWQLEWSAGRFRVLSPTVPYLAQARRRKTG